MKLQKALYLSGSTLWAVCHIATAEAQSMSPALGAQVTPPASASGQASTPGKSDGVVGADIVVTANKRVQRLNDVGVTAAVASGAQMNQQNIHSLSDLATRIPSLSFADAPNGTPVYTLRGVGFYETSVGAYPSVSVYVDEIPLTFPVLTNHATYDLQRVEVLKGPQGTLFGENATGGAINYIAARPTDTFEAGATGTYGRFNEADFDGYISGPVTSTLKARLSGRVETADGWQVSSSTGARNGKVDNFMGRLQVDWRPVDALRFHFNLSGWKDKSETQAGQYIAQQFQNQNLGVAYGLPVGTFQDPLILAAPFSPNNDRAADWSTSSTLFGPGKRTFADNGMLQASLRIDLDVGDVGTLTSLTAYTKYDENQANDTDGLPFNALVEPLNIAHIRTEYQELRFANGSKRKLRYVIGANYEHDTTYEDQYIDYYESSARIGFGDLFGFPLSVDDLANSQRYRNYAFFSDVEWDVDSKITLHAGARYTSTQDKADICQSDPQGPPYPFGNIIQYFSSVYSGTAFTPYTPGSCVSINVKTTDPTQPAVSYLPYGATGAYLGVLEQHNVSWKVGVDYKFAPGILVYGNVSKGFKGGSFPTITGSTLNQYYPVAQESVLAYEGGVKATLFDRRLQINVAGFYYDYSDKQIRTKLADPVFGQLDVLANIPKSSIKGGEIEITDHLFHNLTLTGSYTYLDAKIDRYVGVDAGGDPNVNFAGTAIPYTPKNQFAISTDYNHSLNDNLSLFFATTLNYRSSTIATLGGSVNPATINASSTPCIYCIKGYALVDGQIGIRNHDSGWQIFLWGKNIFNKYYWTNVVSGYDTVSRFSGRPATYGVTISLKFH
jgi:iron complex outermembrane recepter protein